MSAWGHPQGYSSSIMFIVVSLLYTLNVCVRLCQIAMHDQSFAILTSYNDVSCSGKQ